MKYDSVRDVPLREKYEALRTALWSERASFDSHWRELADWMLPRRTRFTPNDRNRGDKRNQNIIDSTGRFALRTLQSGMHAGLTSPARPWFKLTTPDPDLAEFKPVKEWLHLVTTRMQVVFSGTNLYNALPICYGDMGLFGTSAMGMLSDKKDLFRCYSYPIGSYALATNNRGVVNTFIREYELTVAQVVEEFGTTIGRREIDWSNISTTVRDLWERGTYEAPVGICWVVAPNQHADPDKLEARYLPFLSLHYEMGSAQAGNERYLYLRRSGFRSFPIMAPRWEVTGEDSYGTDSPGMTALGDVKQLQMMQRDKARAIKKMIDPPLVGAAELRTQKTSLLPGDITYVRDPQQGLKSIHDIRMDLSHLVQDMGEVQYRIQRAFYEDLFLMMATADQRQGADRPTAREVEERHEEKLLALGPVLERTEDELLDPLIDRTFEMMLEENLVPQAPPELEGVKLDCEYISIMAQAQKLVGVVAQDRFVQALAPMVEVFPDIVDKINVKQLVDNYGDMLGVDPRLIRTNDEADQIAQSRAEAQAAQARAEQMKTVAQAAQAAGQTPVGSEGSLLDAAVAGGMVN